MRWCSLNSFLKNKVEHSKELIAILLDDAFACFSCVQVNGLNYISPAWAKSGRGNNYRGKLVPFICRLNEYILFSCIKAARQLNGPQAYDSLGKMNTLNIKTNEKSKNCDYSQSKIVSQSAFKHVSFRGRTSKEELELRLSLYRR